MIRPNGAYKLLVILLYGQSNRTGYPEPSGAPLMTWLNGTGHSSLLQVHSIRRLARLLGTESKRVNAWLIWLMEHGLISHVIWDDNRRSCQVYLIKPRNI